LTRLMLCQWATLNCCPVDEVPGGAAALLITATREAQAAKCTEHVRAVSPQVLWELKSISSLCHRTIKE